MQAAPPPPDWSGETVVVIASGPSLTPEDCAAVRQSRLRTVVTNSTCFACPWAHAVFAYDQGWWMGNGQQNLKRVEAEFAGRRFTLYKYGERIGAVSLFGATWFRSVLNSGACAISLAVAAKASRIILLGFDCAPAADGRLHHHPDHIGQLSNCRSIDKWPERFRQIARYAREQGVDVVNCSRSTALTCFHRSTLETALEESDAFTSA